jgi:hypothetical protein
MLGPSGLDMLIICIDDETSFQLPRVQDMLLRKWLPRFAIVLIFLATWELALQEKSVRVTDLDQKQNKSNDLLNFKSKSEAAIVNGRPTRSTASVARPMDIHTKNKVPSTGLHVQTDLRLAKAATIVIQLSGEMANNLQHIAHGVGLQLWLKEQFNIPSNVILRHFVGPNNRAPKPKWKSARNDILQCFPFLKNWDFTAGNNKEFLKRQSQQKGWLGEQRMDRLFGMINGQTSAEIESGLALLKDIMNNPYRPVVEDDATIRLPYLYSESLDVYPLLDRSYESFRQLFQIDSTACCAQRPLADESVFHFRNFQSEFPPNRAHDLGFDELSPNKTAHEVFDLASTNTKNNNTTGVAITTRIRNAAARAYVQALQHHGIPARLVTDQTGPQDFCFLASTQKELVVNARSTFGVWAGLIGNATSLRWYHVDNYGLRNRHANFRQRFSYNWTHPELQRRVRFEWYQAEELEE